MVYLPRPENFARFSFFQTFKAVTSGAMAEKEALATGAMVVKGDETALPRLLALLDTFLADFPLLMPIPMPRPGK